jgi:hypothetical protein
MAKPRNYSQLVEQAEKAVQSVKDPELKGIAFQKVLEELLAGGSSSGRGQERKASSRSGSKRKAARGGGTSTYLRELIAEGFFKKPKAITDVKVELENRGHHIPLTSLSGPLQTLCKQRELRRHRSEGRFVYSNW